VKHVVRRDFFDQHAGGNFDLDITLARWDAARGVDQD
jgi:hypothetical protein